MARNDVFLNINALSPADAVVTGQQDMTAATVPELVLGDTPTFNFLFTDNTNVWPSWAGNASYTLTWALSDAVAGDFAPAATTGNATPITGGWSVVLPLNSYDLVGLLNTKRVGQPYPVQNLWQQLRVTDPSGNEVTRAMFWTPVRYRAISDTQNTESASPTGGRFVTVNNVNTLTTPTAAQFYAANPVPTSALGTAANGELLIGNGTGFTKSTLTAGTGITVTNGSGSITIDASGAQETLTATVKNAESVAITKGQVVYLFGATGNMPSVKLAYNTTDATSAKTFGVVSDTSIAPNGTGTVTCVGVVDGLNLGAYQDGDTVYLGATPGSFTATKPYAPNHLVYVGIIERANAGNGELYVRVQNGYELDEIHDVQINSPKLAGQTLIYDATTDLWKNARLTAGVGVSISNGDSAITISADGGVNYQGTWNASTNTPTLTSSVGTKGFYYVVSVAGSTNLNGVTDWKVGDWAIFNGTAWEKVDTTDQVSSVFGRTGAVVGVSTDYSAVGITNTAIGASNPSTGAFTTLSATGNLTVSGTGTQTLNGKLDVITATSSAANVDLAVLRQNYAGTAGHEGLISFTNISGTSVGKIGTRAVDGNNTSLVLRNFVSGSLADALTLSPSVATLAGNLTLSGATSTITLGSSNTASIAVDSNGALTVTPKAGQAVNLGNTASSAAQLFSLADYAASISLKNSSVASADVRNWAIRTDDQNFGDFNIKQSATLGGDAFSGLRRLVIDKDGNVSVPSGNLTVSGTATATNFIPSSGAAASGSIGGSSVYGLEIWGKTGSFSDLIIYNGAGNTLLTNLTGTQNISLAGNLTVSGTGNNVFRGPIRWGNTSYPGYNGYITETNTASQLIPAITRNLIGTTGDTQYTIANAELGAYAAFELGSNIRWFAGTGTFTTGQTITPTELMRLTQGGNFLIGTTTDSANGKLQLATHTTSAGGIGFGTDTSWYRSQGGVLTLDTSANFQGFEAKKNGTLNFNFYSNSSDTFIGYKGTGSLTIQTLTGSPALTLDSSQNATFAGNVVLGAGKRVAYSASAYMTPENNVDGAEIASPGQFTVKTASTQALKIDSSQNATFAGFVGIKDGMTAPSATSGTAKIYVDTADGDLKVIFGDGTVKTIVTD